MEDWDRGDVTVFVVALGFAFLLAILLANWLSQRSRDRRVQDLAAAIGLRYVGGSSPALVGTWRRCHVTVTESLGDDDSPSHVCITVELGVGTPEEIPPPTPDRPWRGQTYREFEGILQERDDLRRMLDEVCSEAEAGHIR